MPTSADRTLEAQLSEFVVAFSRDDIDEESERMARQLIIDQLGLQIGLSDLPWSESASRYALSEGSDGTATVVATGDQVDPATAAFVNATFGHGFEYDDVHNPSNGHPGCVVVPTSLAIGETVDATISEVLTAVVAGYEVYGRLGALGGPMLQNRGWHAHALVGTFGAAAAAAKLWSFDREVVHHALAIAASHASGFLEYSSTGGSVKRVHAGIAARDGIAAAQMAQSGITGPERYLTGRKGFYATFIGDNDIGWREYESGRGLEINHLWTKYYCTCGCIHAYLDAIKDIDPDPEELTRIAVHIQPQSNAVVGTSNENAYDPSDIVEVQYSLPFQLAMSVCGFDNGYRMHRRLVDGDLSIRDPETIEVEHSVEMTVDPTLDERYAPKIVGDLTVEYTDGREVSRFVENPRGTPENPLTDDELVAKFDELTEPVLGREEQIHLRDRLRAFDLSGTASELMNATY